MDERNIGKNIKYYRTEAGLTQSELADMLGLSRQAVSAYEAGDRIPTDLAAVARALSVTIDDLFADESAIPDKCRIEVLLKKKHMSWYDLSKKTGISIGHLKAAQALRVQLGQYALQSIASALGCNTTDLYSKSSITYKTSDIACKKDTLKGMRMVICFTILIPVLFLMKRILTHILPGSAESFGTLFFVVEIALLPVLIYSMLKYMGFFLGQSKLTLDDVIIMNTESMIAARKKSGLSVSSLSKKIGVPAATIRKAERGIKPFTMDNALLYAEAVGLSVDEIFL